MSSEKRKRNKRASRKRRKTKAVAKKREVFRGLPYSKTNYIILGAGLVSIVLGFVILSTGNAIISTILLVLGYIVLTPIALLIIFRRESPQKSVEQPSVESQEEVGGSK